MLGCAPDSEVMLWAAVATELMHPWITTGLQPKPQLCPRDAPDPTNPTPVPGVGNEPTAHTGPWLSSM